MVSFEVSGVVKLAKHTLRRIELWGIFQCVGLYLPDIPAKEVKSPAMCGGVFNFPWPSYFLHMQVALCLLCFSSSPIKIK